jgi:hypothetical protein
MKKLAIAGILAVLAVARPAQSQYIGNNPGKGDWVAGPSGLPKGARMIVLSGNPAKAGPYTIRLRFPPGYKIGPHRHPTEEKIQVVTGGFTYAIGSSREKNLTKGMSATVPAHTYHSASTTVGATVDFVGTGPFRIEYAQAKDGPRQH